MIHNVAYIDGANLDKGIVSLGWKLDYNRFRRWLSDKYSVQRAYIFLGLVPKYKNLYTYLQEAGFTLVFKETTRDGGGNVKGNCDADLVLQAVRDLYEHAYSSVVLVSSDGDYAGLISFLLEKKRMRAILSPNRKCSILIKRTGARIVYLDDQKDKLKLNEKAPGADRTAQGSSSW